MGLIGIGIGIAAGLLPVYAGMLIAVLLAKVAGRQWEAGLLGLTTGVLLYLFFDLMHEAVEFSSARDPLSWAIFIGGLSVGLLGLIWIDSRRAQSAGLLSLPYMIALGMGLHNFGEGLAIGASYASGAWGLSVLLFVGFTLHNGMEGVGIIGAGKGHAFSPRDIAGLGLLAGAPTALGTLVSGQGLSSYWSIACYTMAAGSLLYVVLALTALSYSGARRWQMGVGVVMGIGLMYLTAMLLTLVGGVAS